ncbi:LysR family transcriptional regulator [Micromonospora sp. C28SCA-DRY-2]|uniref:LysR family transcriptional regulator n=1 Tax=Micromonospora sp. C28SCA-DRY-2 TaxID=3059522 RepID=UPI002675D78F|nr:LysR family transcriptional regulator [Micromonospora sp. C28SCA-DRY-2]MDO3704231.1 LysR family transcriptional regulator [Micromonospora sp. C28SCA-DRY-2]
MDPHLLRTFTVVARLRSFSAAAVELGYTQSAVSQHVAALEADLGVRLLDRRPVTPTVAGTRLLAYAEPILLRLAAARADLARLAAPRPGPLRVGATPLVVAAAARLATGRRGALTLHVTTRADLPRRVATDELDLGLRDGFAAPNDPLPGADLGPTRVEVHGVEPVVVALPRDHPLAARHRLALADLALARWVDAPEVAAPLAQLRAVAGADGFRADVRYPGTDVAGLLAVVAAGHGLAVLPAGVVRAGAGLVGVALADPRLVHRVELLRPAPADGPPGGSEG